MSQHKNWLIEEENKVFRLILMLLLWLPKVLRVISFCYVFS